jgi:Zn-dependent protease
LNLNPERLAEGLIYYVVLLFSLSFHESAHAWMASRMGDDTARERGRISLNPIVHMDPIGTVLMPLLQIFGPAGIPLLAWAKPTPVVAANFRPGLFRKGQVLVAGAGPVSNFALAILCSIGLFVLARLGARPGSPGALAFEIILAGVTLNVALGVFNFLPLPPLDGSWVASFGLPRGLGEAYDRIVRPYGMWILLILVLTNALGRVVWPIIRFLRDALVSIAVT